MGVVELFFAIFSSATINYNLRGSTFQEMLRIVGSKTCNFCPSEPKAARFHSMGSGLYNFYKRDMSTKCDESL